MSDKYLTIGIPVYNGEKTIEETLNSCLTIANKNIFFILSDNASTDQTPNICLQYSAKISQFKIFRQDKNIGGAENWMFLLNQCQSEFFMWLAADDVISKFDLNEIMELFEKYPQAVAVSPFAYVLDHAGRKVYDKGNINHIGNIEENILKYLISPGVNSRVSSVYKTERLKQVYENRGVMGEYFGSDLPFSVSILMKGPWPLCKNFILDRKPGISSGGIKNRALFSTNLFNLLFPSPRYIFEIIFLTKDIKRRKKILFILFLLYVRNTVGPMKHLILLYFHKTISLVWQTKPN